MTEIPGARRKALLAALALRIGQPVSSDLLIDVVWSGNTPSTVLNTLQSHMSYLRRTLVRRGCIVASAPGYRLDRSVVETDLQIAEQLISEAERTPDLEQKSAQLQTALNMWRGKPLEDVRGHPWLDEQAERIDRLRYSAVKSLTDARLMLGEHSALIGVLEDLADRHPFDEDLHGQLMLAHYRAGRQADALATFRRLRSRLVDELGINPGRALRDLEQAVLRQDRRLDIQPLEGARRAVSGAAVTQLPPAATPLIGRADELRSLDAIINSPQATSSTTAAPVIAVTGAPGVGKSSVALHWAHQVLPDFPDGRLYVDLRGFDAVKPPVGAAEALRSFIGALGVPQNQLPDEINALAGLYRSLLAGKRVLVLLDNARDADQVRPLLPSAAGCLALVTSRSDLASLAVTNGAHLLRLAPLTTPASIDLLTSRIGGRGPGIDRRIAEHISVVCGGLPLALAIIGCRQLTHPHERIADLAAQMLTPSDALDVLDGGDPSTDLRSVFSTSYERLTDAGADVFRALASITSPEITLTAAKACSGGNESVVRLGLNELVRANLLEVHSRESYTMPPLLRAFAAELTSLDRVHQCS
ncbi:AfsR/SARP family transcriptional regulator [Kribbella ginsengisoli]|uniref:AfsR/SARP family transcriptional regulator n=1 Tax=Kribbella ginsengisoli TaxID=363865 RepID=UPI0031DAE199